MAVAAQVALLGAWSTHTAWFAAHAWALGLGCAVIAISRSTWMELPSAMAYFFEAPRTQHLAFGSLGMLLGAWADAGFNIPPCMCCLWGPQTPTLVMLSEQLRTYSTLGMLVSCGAAMLFVAKLQRQNYGLGQLYLCIVELLGMCLAMMALMRPTAEMMRHVSWGKLELGHGFMVASMALGASISVEVARLLTASPRTHQTLEK